jgi:hypothetical protein
MNIKLELTTEEAKCIFAALDVVYGSNLLATDILSDSLSISDNKEIADKIVVAKMNFNRLRYSVKNKIFDKLSEIAESGGKI